MVYMRKFHRIVLVGAIIFSVVHPCRAEETSRVNADQDQRLGYVFKMVLQSRYASEKTIPALRIEFNSGAVAIVDDAAKDRTLVDPSQLARFGFTVSHSRDSRGYFLQDNGSIGAKGAGDTNTHLTAQDANKALIEAKEALENERADDAVNDDVEETLEMLQRIAPESRD